ncbi:hypothetical protein [Streptomyces goshikiensis]|uniref:hypothetical protein n=1 Tax=Streptomyces goshikiensis TaxID=1942 RepID=UPI0036CD3ADC
MTTITRHPAQPLRFTAGDTVTDGEGLRWVRGLRQLNEWALPGGSSARSDESMRAALNDPTSVFTPTLPSVYRPLPGTPCSTTDAVQNLVLRPASGATLHTASLNSTQSFLGNEGGVLRSRPALQTLTPTQIMVALRGTLVRHPAALIAYHRYTGRIYARYPVGNALHTHVYVLTTNGNPTVS